MKNTPIPKLSVVIPVYNEAKIVESAGLELRDALVARGYDFEIIFAENGSKDGTREILARMAASDSRLRHLHFEAPNYGAALKQGILAARGEYVVCDEIDLCDVSFYEQALPLLESGDLDLVIGSKAARGSSDERPLIRRAATRVHNGLLRVTLGFRGTDTHGLKAFRREALLPIVEACVVDRDVFASELVLRAWRSGIAVQELPITLREKRRPSIHLFRRVPNVLKNVARLIYVIRVREP